MSAAPRGRTRRWFAGGAFALALLLGGVPAARAGDAGGPIPAELAPAAAAAPAAGDGTNDPLQPVNRAIFRFNDGVDTWVLRPVAVAWDTVLPDAVENCLENFFENLRFPVRLANNALQGRIDPTAVTLWRFLLNTTIGIGGLFDVARHLGLEYHYADFGQTLGVWGVPAGPYLVLPVFGPSNPRDTAGMVADGYLNGTGFFVPWGILAIERTLEVVNSRAIVLDEIDRAREASLDFYVAVRSAYLKRREMYIGHRAQPTPLEEEELYFPEAALQKGDMDTP